jgi:hypothetical protein
MKNGSGTVLELLGNGSGTVLELSLDTRTIGEQSAPQLSLSLLGCFCGMRVEFNFNSILFLMKYWYLYYKIECLISIKNIDIRITK